MNKLSAQSALEIHSILRHDAHKTNRTTSEILNLHTLFDLTHHG